MSWLSAQLFLLGGHPSRSHSEFTLYLHMKVKVKPQLCLTLWDPMDYAVCGILQARTVEWVAISSSNSWKRKLKVKSLSRYPTLSDPMTAAYQAYMTLYAGFPSILLLPAAKIKINSWTYDLLILILFLSWRVWFPRLKLSVRTLLVIDRCYLYAYMGFPGSSAGKESTCNVGDMGLIPALERSPGKGNGYPLQYSCLENSR